MDAVSAVVFGLAGLMVLVAFLPPLARRLGVPDTVLMAALGCLIGLAIGFGDGLSAAAPGAPLALDFLAGLAEIELGPQLFLAVFLPLLLFETALRLDARALLDDLAPVLVMAVVAVVVTTALAGGVLALASPVPLAGALLVAAIIATTDPVAVVAVFREVGAPLRLTRLVEGESLLNDAAAIALFAALLAILVGGGRPDPLDLLTGFAWQFVGGALFGTALGRVAAATLARLDDGGPAEVTLAVALPYLAYVLGGSYLGVSGVVAVVLAGLVYGDAARARLPGAAWRTVLAFWEQLAFWASSLIFVLAATTIPATLREARASDIVLLAALIAGATLARAVAIYLILPLTLGAEQRRGLQRDHKLVMLWGGLRGAVTLALVLGVKDNLLLPQEVRHAVAVLATGFVLFTLLVQATTLRPLIRLLELDRLSPLESLVRARALEASRADIAERVRQAATAIGVGPPRAEPVPVPHTPTAEDLTRAQLLGALATVTRREIELLVEEQARSLLPRRAAARMIAEARSLLDALRTSGLDGYRRAARRQSGFDRTTRLAAAWHRRTGRPGPLRRRLADRVVRLLVRRDVLEQIIAFIDRRIEALFGARIAELAGRVVQARLEDTERGLDAVRLQYPDYWQALTTRYLQVVALQLERQALHAMAAEGLLSPSLHRSLLGELAARERDAEAVPDLDLGLDVHRLMAKLPLLGGLAAERLEELAALLRPRLALPGERILAKGSPGDAMYFIASGAVEVLLDTRRVRLGSGDFFGELALLTRRPRVADVIALGYCQLLALRREDFRRFLRAHPELVAVMRQVASERAGRALGPSL